MAANDATYRLQVSTPNDGSMGARTADWFEQLERARRSEGSTDLEALLRGALRSDGSDDSTVLYRSFAPGRHADKRRPAADDDFESRVRILAQLIGTGPAARRNAGR